MCFGRLKTRSARNNNNYTMPAKPFHASIAQQNIAVDRIVSQFEDIDPDYVIRIVAECADSPDYMKDAIAAIQKSKTAYPKISNRATEKSSSSSSEVVDFNRFETAVPAKAKKDAISFLESEFPHIRPDFFLRILKLHNFHLYPSWLALMKLNRSYNISIINKESELAQKEYLLPKKVPKSIKQYSFSANDIEKNLRPVIGVPSLLEGVIDGPLHREIAYIYTVKKVKKNKYEHEALVAQQHSVAEDMVTCSCCFCERVPAELIACLNGHLVCAECIRQQIETILGKPNVLFRCVGDANCYAVYNPSDIERVIGGGRKFQQWMNQLQAQKAQGSGFTTLHCPFCTYFEALPYLVPEENTLTIDQEATARRLSLIPPAFQCRNPSCGRKSCTYCHQEAHPDGKMCPKQKKRLESMNAVEEEFVHYIETKMTEARIHPCPWCGVPINKTEACNHMTCQKCHHDFCYRCGIKLPEGGHGGVYDHFHKPNSCPLQAGTSQEEMRRNDEIAVQNAAKKAMDEWLDAHPNYKGHPERLDQLLKQTL